MKKLVPFVREVFAPGLHLLYTAFWYLALSGSLSRVEGRPLSLDALSFAAIGTLFLVLLYLRFADEIKDADYDRVYNPDRPLVRGLVDTRYVARCMAGTAALALLLNAALVPWLGLAPFVIVALDLAWGAALIVIERRSAAVRNGIFLNLFLTYPVNVALSVYTYALFMTRTGATPSLLGVGVVFAFVVAFLSYELGRKTAWPEHARPDERLYSARLGARAAIELSFACALLAVLGLGACFVLVPAGSLLEKACALSLLFALRPALTARRRFLAERGERLRLVGLGTQFLVFFYLGLTAYTLAIVKLDPLGWSLGAFAAGLFTALVALPLLLRLVDTPITPDRIASLFYVGAEHVMRGNTMVITLRFKQPLDLARVRESYERFVRVRPSVRMKWVEHEPRRAFGWEPLDDSELESLLARERAHLSSFVSQQVADSAYERINQALPFRLTMVDTRTLVCSIHHAWGTGNATLFWLCDWYRFYRDTYAELSAPVESLAPRPGVVARCSAAVVGVFWALGFALSFFRKVSGRTGVETVDLTQGKTPDATVDAGFTVRRFSFSVDETRRLIDVAKARKLTIGEALALTLVQLLFEAQPEKRRVLVSLPVDLARYVPWVSRTVPGNFTGSVCVQFFRDRDLEAQVRAAFRWPKRGVPYWLIRLFGLFGKNEFALRDAFAEAAHKPLAARGPYDAHSCAWSNLGRISLPGLDCDLTSISGHAKTQTLMLTGSTLHDALSLEACFSNQLFEPTEVLPLLDALPARLSQSSEASEPYVSKAPVGMPFSDTGMLGK